MLPGSKQGPPGLSRFDLTRRKQAMAPKKPEPKDSEQPKGTLVIVFTYMVTIIVLWSWVYLTLIERGVTR